MPRGKITLTPGADYWVGAEQVKLEQLLPQEAEARKDALVLDLVTGRKYWVASASLKEERQETAQERYERQEREAQAAVAAEMTSEAWISSGGKSIIAIQYAEAIYDFDIGVYTWGRYETGAGITHQDAEALYAWLKVVLKK